MFIAEIGLLLRDKITKQLRFFYPGSQILLFKKSVKLRKPQDVETILNNYNEEQIKELLINSFPNSNYIYESPVCIRVFIVYF